MIDQVITPETSDTITAMLVSSINVGFAKVAKVKGYRMAGKTGTSQIAGPGGKYESGTGSNLSNVCRLRAGSQSQVPDPCEIDRPRRDIYGSQTAGPVFRDIAAFLFKYYGYHLMNNNLKSSRDLCTLKVHCRDVPVVRLSIIKDRRRTLRASLRNHVILR